MFVSLSSENNSEDNKNDDDDEEENSRLLKWNRAVRRVVFERISHFNTYFVVLDLQFVYSFAVKVLEYEY